MALLSLRSSTRPVLASRSGRSLLAVPVPVKRSSARSLSVVVRAAEDTDFDAVLNKLADKFEKAENKPVVIGYVAAAAAAFFISEWLIHLPALDIILGFPVQLVGLLALPFLGVRWFVDGKDASKDIEDAAGTIISKLPGLEKK